MPAFVADSTGLVLSQNRRFRELLGSRGGAQGSLRLADFLGDGSNDQLASLTGEDFGPWEVGGRGEPLASRWFELRGRAAGSDRASYFAILLDVTERKRQEEELRHHASHDLLTGLPRRTLIVERIQQALAHSSRDPTYHFAVLFLDFDRFKVINDSFGHLVGDQLLVAAVTRIRSCLQRAGDAIARFGGDEIVILLDDCSDSSHAVQVAERILGSLSKPFVIADQELFTGFSIGIAMSDGAAADADALLRDADTAMYRAKARGKGGYELFDHDMHEAAVALSHREMALRRAVEREEFELVYQPILGVGSAEVLAFEALLRWRTADGLLLPAAFLPLAEETGLIVQIGEWALREACTQAQAWRDAGYALRVAVNLSSLELQQRDLAARVQRVLGESGLPPAALLLEITQGAILRDPRRGLAMLDQLRGLGVGLVMDCFGNGWFSFEHLRSLPVEALKIDHSLIEGLLGSSADAAIIKAVIDLGHSLGLQVMAGGVEHPRQVTFLRAHGCDALQGHYFRAALSPAQLRQLLLDGERTAGSGGRFHLKLPGAAPITAQALDLAAGERTVEPSALRGVRVLVVEDEADSRDTLCWILRLHGAESIPAASGAEALDLVQSARADILVCDIGLPDQDGYRLLKKIRQLPRAAGGAIPAVALTGYARVEDRVRALDAGFQTHASKPIEPAELVAVVASLTRAKTEPLAGSTALAR